MTNKEGSKTGPVMISVCALGFLLFYFGRYFNDAGPDYILHFTLVDEIMRSGGVAPDAVNRISVMAYYPPVSHWMAALIGWASGSGLVGITLVSIVATFITFLFAARIVANTPVRLALFLAAFLAFSKTSSLVGWEVVGRFFYPQLVGDAFYFFALFCLVKTERIAYRSAAFIVIGTLTMWVQPISALQIMAAGCVLLALDGVRLWRDRGAFPLRYAALAIAALLVSLIIVAEHPEFKLMRQISSNNGALEFPYSHIMLMVAACAVICALNAWRYVFRNAEKSDLVLGAAGIAACLLAFFQFLAWELHGDGSPYAVKKHMFVVVTLGVMNGVRLATALIDRSIIRRQSLVDYATPLIAAYMSSFALQGFSIPIAPMVRALADAKEIAAYQFPKLTSGNTVFYDGSLPVLSNALISRIAFKHPLDYRWWAGMKITDGVPYAMIHRTSASDEACVHYAWSTEYVIADSSCLLAYKPGDAISFASTGSGNIFLDQDWFSSEPWGTWAKRDGEVQLAIPKGSGPYQIDVDAMAFLNARHKRQQVVVEVNGTRIAKWDFEVNAPEGERTATIPEGLIKDGSVKIVFRALGAVSPKQIGESEDGRVLGIGLKTLTLRAARQDTPGVAATPVPPV
jgi:hypothetical protein